MVIQFPGHASQPTYRRSRPGRETHLPGTFIGCLQAQFPDLARTRPELLGAIASVLDRAQAAVGDASGNPPTGR